jgi:alkyl hydroperoxide reductase subunit AhpC
MRRAIKREANAMPLQLNDTVPNFTQDSTNGPLNFYEYAGNSWIVLFSHPKDFTPVCTTELGAVAKLKPEFDRRGVKIIGISIDATEDHAKWARDIEETQGAKLNFPIIADSNRKVASLYEMIHPNADDTMTVRSVFIIDPNKKLRLTLTYPASTGRSFQEILRVVDSLQLTDKHKVATPADWRQGQDVIILPAVSNDEARMLFPQGWKELRPYLRTIKQPAA